ncbi:ergothioneine biosynthesis protein EgtC [Streptomonospora nanhaiensis]|uniref:ergothioneine biosynthesis protein EgtC n=1 Tax=Streptomonospora nanhaiensis TaxID=1323731 RepID=UPI001C393D6E|nr:ergothioneine biosynthesis protein EgtC [Streptomonospora nanhaiensis]MBV2365604.1 ergothioneine biosynthesis protein EgtC [Streptomonospora nanhaiensis]MBX9389585.1 ergothioneine biosynthesis protein EgtC [Streptomonospora nanhaiensis]
MCRHLAYLGAPRTLHDLVYASPASLLTQSYAPREQRQGTVNADGFGVGWYVPGRTGPLRYRRAMPIWADASFADAAQALTTTCLVAAVRDATPGFGTDESCAQPFRADSRLFSHNGAAADHEELAARLGHPLPRGVLDARTPVDSAPLFAAAVRLWRAGEELGAALARVAREARACSAGRYNLLAADGRRLAATAAGDTLYVRHGCGGVWLASEPLDDDPAWRRVPDRTLVTADRDGYRLTGISAVD